jgi:oxygen-independent coproporphyrinogen-3 oxidase
VPLNRALPTTPRDQLIREMILQLKTGGVGELYFHKKFGVWILEEFADAFKQLTSQGLANVCLDALFLTRKGLLQIDRYLPMFFDAQYRSARYT